MYSKISNWLLLQDERFLSGVKDERQRKKLLDQLYGMRMMCVFAFLFPITVFIIGAVLGSSDPVTLLMFFAVMLFYVVIDSVIRAIRLYELSIAFRSDVAHDTQL